MSTYQIPLDQTNDIVEESDVKVSSALWSGGTGTLNNVYTSSVQSSSNGQYFLQVYDKDVSSSLAEKQFSILYGHKGGSGSLGKPGVDGNRETATVYSQMLNLTQPPETELFTFENGTDVTKQHIYAISFDRARAREKVDPGNWQLNLSGNKSTVKVELIDDSGDTQQSATQIGRVYNLVSGSILNGVYSPKTYYGQVYPEQGVIVLNANTMNSSLGFGTVTGSNINGDNAFKLHTSISGAAVINANNGFQARNEERVQSTFYFVRAKNGEYNFSNNPSYVTGSNGGFRQPTFANNPKSYITTVGLYNSTQELLAVAKLSQPILKSFSNEVLVKVKLDF